MLVWIVGWLLVASAAAAAAVATVQNLRSARGPSERRFVLITCLTFWIASFSCLGLAAFLRSPWRYVIAGLYIIVVTPGIFLASKKRQLIRRAEQMRDEA